MLMFLRRVHILSSHLPFHHRLLLAQLFARFFEAIAGRTMSGRKLLIAYRQEDRRDDEHVSPAFRSFIRTFLPAAYFGSTQHIVLDEMTYAGVPAAKTGVGCRSLQQGGLASSAKCGYWDPIPAVEYPRFDPSALHRGLRFRHHRIRIHEGGIQHVIQVYGIRRRWSI